MSGKPGRPPEDRVRRKIEIWRAVAPMIERDGARNLTMRQAAAASFMSLGGLYHYFPNKLDLVLFGLDPKAIHTQCADFENWRDQADQPSAEAAVDEFVRLLADITFFKRPAVQAALELGTEDSRSRLENHVNVKFLEVFIETLGAALPEANDADLRAVAKAARQLSFATAIDRSMSREEFEQELRAIFRAVPTGHRHTGFAVAGQADAALQW